ncbi:MAG: hypothetical protein AAF984_08035 [Verrucomicrobiota bacterium]
MDFNEKSFIFARKCRELVHDLPVTPTNNEDGLQLVCASGQMAKAIIDFQENDGDERIIHMRRVRQHTKACVLWLKLLDCGRDSSRNALRDSLINDTEAILKKLDEHI